MKLKDLLKKLRQEQGLSRQQLAERVGMSARTIEGYEQGAREPKDSTLERLAEALNVNSLELIKSTKRYRKYYELFKQGI